MNLGLAKKRISELQEFVDLVENYPTTDLKSHMIKEYAINGSLEKTATKMNDLGFSIDGREIIKNDVVEVVNTNKKVDELHRIVRLNYRKKIKPNKPTWQKYNF